MKEGFGPGEPRARARGCTCKRYERPLSGREWNTAGCPRHSGLYGGQLPPHEDDELYDDLKARLGRKKADEVWELSERAAVHRPSWPLASRLHWAEQQLELGKEYPG